MEKERLTEKEQHEMFLWKQSIGRWKALYMRGDAELLAQQTGVTKVTILKAIKTGNSSYEVLRQIASFYQNRKQLLNKKEN